MPIVKYEKGGKELEIDVPDEAFKKIETESFDKGVTNALDRYNKSFREQFSEQLKGVNTDAQLKELTEILAKNIRETKLALEQKGGDDTELAKELLELKKVNADLVEKAKVAETNAPLIAKKLESMAKVKGNIIGMGLRDERQEDIDYYINKSFSQQTDQAGNVVWMDSKGIPISPGDSASIERKVTDLFKESNADLFEVRKGGAGVNSSSMGGSGEPKDLKESSVDDLIGSGLDELAKSTK